MRSPSTGTTVRNWRDLRVVDKSELVTSKGDECDSRFEVQVIEDLIARNVSYVHHPDKIGYHRPVRGGFCLDCDSNHVRKGALYEPDLYLPIQDITIELKGGSMTAASRGRLVNVIQSGKVIHFLFRQDRKLSKASKTRYSAWATRYKCPWHIGMTVPEEWL
jgi:hypothetical protein